MCEILGNQLRPVGGQDFALGVEQQKDVGAAPEHDIALHVGRQLVELAWWRQIARILPGDHRQQRIDCAQPAFNQLSDQTTEVAQLISFAASGFGMGAQAVLGDANGDQDQRQAGQ